MGAEAEQTEQMRDLERQEMPGDDEGVEMQEIEPGEGSAMGAQEIAYDVAEENLMAAIPPDNVSPVAANPFLMSLRAGLDDINLLGNPEDDEIPHEDDSDGL